MSASDFNVVPYHGPAIQPHVKVAAFNIVSSLYATETEFSKIITIGYLDLYLVMGNLIYIRRFDEGEEISEIKRFLDGVGLENRETWAVGQWYHARLSDADAIHLKMRWF